MTAATASEAVVLGAMTGMRSMGGIATLGAGQGGLTAGITTVMALGEMIADKSPEIGDRTDAAPLMGRLTMGGLTGGRVAQQRGHSVLLGALLGASAAVVAAHLAREARVRLPFPNLVNGLIEDGVFLGMAAIYLQQTRGRR